MPWLMGLPSGAVDAEEGKIAQQVTGKSCVLAFSYLQFLML